MLTEFVRSVSVTANFDIKVPQFFAVTQKVDSLNPKLVAKRQDVLQETAERFAKTQLVDV